MKGGRRHSHNCRSRSRSSSHVMPKTYYSYRIAHRGYKPSSLSTSTTRAYSSPSLAAPPPSGDTLALTMLMLPTLHNLLSQVLAPPFLHTAVLLTPAGELVSAASEPSRPKDDIRIIVGLSGEVWQETREQGYGMVDSELGRIIVLPVDEFSSGPEQPFSDEHQPLMLLALNATDAVEWEELDNKGKTLAGHIAKPLSKFRELIVSSKPSRSTTVTTSPAPVRS
ncbi:unnamed protein product [Cyclocybe aegerita]|uniref:Uncharacterized protein n=1 Tax=Cyclocybe aegerita TaxID=1973307 RepID=A0A8S0WSW6_CYCAE|nr:unnamed protein product [Cyclocybe aegerita]